MEEIECINPFKRFYGGDFSMTANLFAACIGIKLA